MIEPRTIPQIRARLHEIARDLNDFATEGAWFAAQPDEVRSFAAMVSARASEIHALADETKRRTPVKHARVSARRVTPEIAREVRDLVRAEPRLTNREIGRRLGIDGGRVSEVLAGKRGEPPEARI
jgi:hypothetical protein